MKLNSNDGARRKLQFAPSSQTTYYLDISSDKVKAKAVQRILSLHGKIEQFLSKDVNLVLTDKNNIAKEEIPASDVTQKQLLPFSRGKALLLKAAKRKSLPNDPVQNAHMLGVEIQKVTKFLKDTECIQSKEKKSRNKAGMLDGIEPLTWAEKENYPIVKCEDILKNYRPLIKNLDVFPQVRYDPDLASPFDKNAMLVRKSKENVNRYAVQKQTLPVSNRGGFCEACDHWYKCSLRQHLNSERHLKFIRDITNYKVLDEIMLKLPSLETFAKKFNLSDKTHENETIEEPHQEGYQASVPAQEEGEQDRTESGEVFTSCTDQDTITKTTVSFYKENKTDCIDKQECENNTEYLDLPRGDLQNQEMKDVQEESNVTTSHKNEDNKRQDIPDMYFSPIHSPSYAPDNLSFADLANRWMADIKSACVNANKDSHSFIPDKNTKIQPSDPHQLTTEPICKPTSSVRDSKSISSTDCDKNQQTVTVSPKNSASCLTSSDTNPVSNNVTDSSDNDVSHAANANLVATKSETPQPVVQTKVPVNRRLTYSPCVSKADNNSDESLRDFLENKENQPNVHQKEQGQEPVQQPIKIKINLNSLKVNPNVHLVKSHRKRSRGSSLSNVYCAVQQSDMKLKLCKVKVTPVQQNGDLRHYWKVRKSGGCRLVFSSEKRKASEEVDDVASKRKRFEVQ
ncbi:protein DBF4 homolog A-like [Saccostrea cucullata]|uniref:protein DBF4 homolog A-like n=1 Tax=Saccostrea cuccullata TaxID=36930 RepID=UPI002ED091F0